MKIDGIGEGSVVRRDSAGHFTCVNDEVAIEAALELRLGGEALAITMRTPGHDEELVAGFLLAEEIVRTREELRELRRISDDVVDISLTHALKPGQLRRYGTISSSCGLCGKVDLESIRTRFGALAPAGGISLKRLLALPKKLQAGQGNFARTGGLHAAGIFGLTDDAVEGVREDIGRHNAVDKVVGRAFLDGRTPLSQHALMVSGRASLEIVQKALAAGIPIVASVSAPSSLAINFARAAGQMLVGFLRPPTFNIYAHAERLLLPDEKS